jgi:hypothetical protein
MAKVIPARIDYDTRVCLDDGQETPIGKVLGHLYYQTKLIDLWNQDQRSGYPHNGGQHTLSIHADAEDIISWLELVEEYYDGTGYDKFPAPEFALMKDHLKRKDRPKSFKLRKLIHDATQIEVDKDNSKIWVNGINGCMARFTATGYEVMEWDLQSVKAACSKPTEGLSLEDFSNFCEYVWMIHNVRIDKDSLSLKES